MPVDAERSSFDRPRRTASIEAGEHTWAALRGTSGDDVVDGTAFAGVGDERVSSTRVELSMPSFATSPEIVARHLLLEGVRRLVPDERVVSAMRNIPRELFVRREDRPLAYANRTLPAEGGGAVPEPLVVARVLSALAITPSDRVMVAGGDGGYVAAIVSRLARDVTLVDAESGDPAELVRRLGSLGARPCIVTGPPLEGWEEQAPFDAIVVTMPQVDMPPALVAQLGLGGRLAIPMKDADGEMLARVVREGIGRLRLDRLGDVRGTRTPSWPRLDRAS